LTAAGGSAVSRKTPLLTDAAEGCSAAGAGGLCSEDGSGDPSRVDATARRLCGVEGGGVVAPETTARDDASRADGTGGSARSPDSMATLGGGVSTASKIGRADAANAGARAGASDLTTAGRPLPLRAMPKASPSAVAPAAISTRTRQGEFDDDRAFADDAAGSTLTGSLPSEARSTGAAAPTGAEAESGAAAGGGWLGGIEGSLRVEGPVSFRRPEPAEPATAGVTGAPGVKGGVTPSGLEGGSLLDAADCRVQPTSSSRAANV
jgi:hypothetical protein